MVAFAKAIIITLFATLGFIVVTNLIFFFPWYMTMIYETYNLTQIAASDNYVGELVYEEILDNLRARPIFNEEADKVKIEVTNANESTFGFAIGNDNASIYANESDGNKPYVQRGEEIRVTIKAQYPFKLTVFGNEIRALLPVEFSLTTIGLRHYKDLDFYDDID